MPVLAESASLVADQACAVVANEPAKITLVNGLVSLMLFLMLLNFSSVVGKKVALFALEVAHVEMPLSNVGVQRPFRFTVEPAITLGASPNAVIT